MFKNDFKALFFFLLLVQFINAQTAPIAVDDNVTAYVNKPLIEQAPGILGNDTDLDSEDLTVIKFVIDAITYNAGETANFTQGSISIFEDGSFTYNPTLNYIGNLPSIAYTISNGTLTSTANLNITVEVPPNPPVAADDNLIAFLNMPLNEKSPGVLRNDTDADSDNLKVTEFVINAVTYVAGETATFTEGSISIFEDGSLTYRPTLDYLGSLPLITYTISDGTFTSSANLNIIVELPPNPPVAVDDNFVAYMNTPLIEKAPGVLANDTDVNSDDIKVTEYVINAVTYDAGETATFSEGSILILEDGNLTYNPTLDYLGSLPLITYTISDGTNASSANLNITVELPPNPPVAIADSNSTEMNTILMVDAPGLLSNDFDIDGDDISVVGFSINGTNYAVGVEASFPEGNITITSDGGYTFNPLLNYTGAVSTITYTISDGTLSATADLFLTVFETTENLLDITLFGTCNQGFTANGNYKISYNIAIRNASVSIGDHPSSLIKNLNLTNDLNSTFGNGCIISIENIFVVTDNSTEGNYLNNPYPKEFDASAINSDFQDKTSSSFFTSEAIANLTLYPRQFLRIRFCVTVDPFCNGRPNPTPSGSKVDFDSVLDVTSNKGNVSQVLTIEDNHTTEAIVAAGLYVPEFSNRQSNPPGVVNPDGTYDYVNTVIITNEGTANANNVNFNMGLGSFLNNGITFNDIAISQVSGPTVSLNNSYDGDTSTELLAPNTSLAPGETIVLELSYLIGPYSNTRNSLFNQINLSQTQGDLDGFDESLDKNKRQFSFVTWSDNLGDHMDRYYEASSPTANITSENQCICIASGMRFLFNTSTSTEKVISEVTESPNGILEQEEVNFQITIKNTSESIQLQNLQIQDNINNFCEGNILSVSTPTIINTTANITPTLNPSFNGVTDVNIFNGSSGLLKVDEIITIQYTVLFSETCTGSNAAIFTSTDPVNDVVQSSGSVTLMASTDTDNDGITNDIDLDDDNDTIPDLIEYNGLNPMDDDDSDFIPNYRDTDFGADTNSDGIVDIFDFDADGVPNHFDLDSDNDGILDIVEAGNIILNTANTGSTTNPVGSNGLDDSVENDDSNNATITFIIPNSDTDVNPDYLDIDADGDGIVDNIEAQLTTDYQSLSGVVSPSGIDLAYPNGINPVDTDNDSIFDFIDTNSDNDIRDDILEGWDTNSDGTAEITPLNIDSDNDGLDDAFDTNNNQINPTNGQTPLSFPNADNTDNPERDWREIIAIVVNINNVSVTEGGDLIFTITLVTKNNNTILIESASPININFSTSDGTDSSNIYDAATSPFDYVGRTNSVFTIPALTTATTFTITSLEDPIFERIESFTLNGVITSNNTLNTTIKGIGSLIDNENAPSIIMNNSREEEGIDLEHTIIISHPSSTPIIIDVNTVDNLATSPDDYTSISTTLTIEGTVDPNSANTEISFSITTFTDNLNEIFEETIDINGVVTSGNIGVQDLLKTGTILDIDPNPLIQINDVTVEEGNTMLFTITLLNANLEPMRNQLPINLILETIDDTTIANEDYEPINNFTNIPAFTTSITQTINTIDDRLNEDTEIFFLQANVGTFNTSNTTPPRGRGFIKDNDYPNLFSPNSDGKSDVFKISSLEDYPNFKLIIFSRLGNEVFNYSNNGRTNPIWWDGTYNGKPVPVGVYYYTLDFNDNMTKPRSSFIQLIR